jgi:hypothetical protein
VAGDVEVRCGRLDSAGVLDLARQLANASATSATRASYATW